MRRRRLAPYFARLPSRDRVLAYLCGLLSEAERKHSWQVAEVCGEATPTGVQNVLSRADLHAVLFPDELHTDPPNIWGILTACWSSTNPGSSKKAGTRLASPARAAGNRGQQGQPPNRRVSERCQPAGPRTAGSGTLSAPGMDRRSGALSAGRHSGGGPGLCHQAASWP